VLQSGTGDIEERITRLEQHDQRLTRALELLARHEDAPAVKTGRGWDAYAAVIASFIGILALAVSGYTAYVQRQQLRAQVLPRLQLVYSSVNPHFVVLNQGTGPASVTAMRVTVGGAPVRTWSDVQKAAGFTGNEGVVSSDLDKAMLPAGKEFVIAQPADSEESRAKFIELLPRPQARSLDDGLLLLGPRRMLGHQHGSRAGGQQGRPGRSLSDHRGREVHPVNGAPATALWLVRVIRASQCAPAATRRR
jgi:hypothetical protein